jgi:hypothetical protein
MPYPTTTWSAPTAPTTTWTSGPTQGAPGCELKVAVPPYGYTIQHIHEWICRLDFPIELFTAGPGWDQTP